MLSTGSSVDSEVEMMFILLITDLNLNHNVINIQSRLGV